MDQTTAKLKRLLKSGSDYLSQTSESALEYKVSPEKWSKKEVLGHLTDSGINNLQRFTEIQYENKPYKIRKYKQDELVKANRYQESDINELLQLWTGLNLQIMRLMKQQTEETLNYEIELPDGSFSDLRFLMIDYVDHLEHHLNQIITN